MTTDTPADSLSEPASGGDRGPAVSPARWIVVMGVSGCGKSSVAQAVAARLGLPMIEGDAWHPPANVEKMRAGMPLDDADRAGWLDTLGGQMAAHEGGAVLSCSALRRVYRDRLRRAVPTLEIVFLDLDRDTAAARVGARPGHFMPAVLVDSQFDALERPEGEPGVHRVDAAAPMEAVVEAACRALVR